MTVGYKFRILNNDGSPSDTIVDMDDMFVSADTFYEKGLYSWGSNANGQLGDGTNISKSSPVQVGSLTNWKQISGGYAHTLALETDGTLWTWGRNNSGELGDGTIVSKSSPIQIGLLTDWKKIEAGNASSGSQGFSFAIKTNHTLWAWGENDDGQLGINNVNLRSSPVQVGSLTDWKDISAGRSVLAIKTDGTLWAWGLNTSGQLGDDTVIRKSSPVQIGLLTDWKKIFAAYGTGTPPASHSLAIKTDGTLWAWGGNAFGQLGDGTIVHKSSPVQIGSLTNWKQISGGEDYSLAVKTDGTLWAWGKNDTGQLGDGTIVSKSSPIQIGSLTNWKQVAGGQGSTAAIKTDGTLWTWGRGVSGRLGDGTIVDKSSPIQVGSLTNWKQVTTGEDHLISLTSNDY